MSRYHHSFNGNRDHWQAAVTCAATPHPPPPPPAQAWAVTARPGPGQSNMPARLRKPEPRRSPNCRLENRNDQTVTIMFQPVLKDPLSLNSAERARGRLMRRMEEKSQVQAPRVSPLPAEIRSFVTGQSIIIIIDRDNFFLCARKQCEVSMGENGNFLDDLLKNAFFCDPGYLCRRREAEVRNTDQNHCRSA